MLLYWNYTFIEMATFQVRHAAEDTGFAILDRSIEAYKIVIFDVNEQS